MLHNREDALLPTSQPVAGGIFAFTAALDEPGCAGRVQQARQSSVAS